GLQPGVYDVRVAFVNPVTRASALNLAIAGRDVQGRYLIGEIVVQNP
ncbi:MAG: hypothetical protein IT326_02945, partial [Anaerolineae bacterium]|nr:hypothetical protein [Anaerolineae bacterium]